jgi:ubiquinone/menaquinone biosynthesis C-methylase UbiE
VTPRPAGAGLGRAPGGAIIPAMAQHRVCPWWIGYLLLVPLRRLRSDPRKLLGPLLREGMTVLEPGPGMGFFTLDVARMVGPTGRVIAVDVQEKMLRVLRRRAGKAGLGKRIETRLVDQHHAQPPGPVATGFDDLEASVDLVLALLVVHEMPDVPAFFAAARRALRPGGRLLFAEPRRHVPKTGWDESMAAALRAGFTLDREFGFPGSRAVLLR